MAKTETEHLYLKTQVAVLLYLQEFFRPVDVLFQKNQRSLLCLANLEKFKLVMIQKELGFFKKL